MTDAVFRSADLVPLWDRPAGFLPVRPEGGLHHWRFATIRDELERVAGAIPASLVERRVALLSHPDLEAGVAAEGVNVGVQMLLAGESAPSHRHTPNALRIGLSSYGVMTTVDDGEYLLDPLDMVLNPSGTWHAHHGAADGPAASFWLDVVDLPLVSALGATLFAPSAAHDIPELDPPARPETIRYPWSDVEASLAIAAPIDGIRSVRYGQGPTWEVVPTLGVSAHRVASGAIFQLPRRTGSSVVLVGEGQFQLEDVELHRFDVVTVRPWTELTLVAEVEDALLIVVDTTPALARLQLFREDHAR